MRVYHSTESYIAMVNEIHKGKYDYSETVFTKMGEKIIVICPEHGRFYPKAGGHKITGCPKCFDARRHLNKSQPKEEFLNRLKAFNPDLEVVGDYVNASVKVLVRCKIHGDEFMGVPTRLLQYKNTCPSCNRDQASKRHVDKHIGRVPAEIAKLPKNIKVVTKNPTWGGVTEFSCDYHGSFTTQVKLLHLRQYVCNECAKEHLKGKSRVSYQEYKAHIKKLFPKPPAKITLVKDSYDKNAGTKLVHLHCEQHGDFIRERSTINNGKLGTPCPSCKAHGLSTPELEVVKFLREFVDCYQGDRKLIAPKELDCYVPEKKLAVEMCGLYWHSELKINNSYHSEKLKLCNDKGIDLIQIFEDEWVNQQNICKSILRNRLGVTGNKFFARQLQVVPVTGSKARVFIEANHIQGFAPAQHYLGMEKEGELIAIASFSFNRLKKDEKWELVRYCSLLDTTVVGGLSRLCKAFMKQHQVSTLLSYCCLRWFNGAGYEAAGFVKTGQTQPSYFYTNKVIRISRYSAKKHKLEKKLPNFDDNLTEWENMANAGFTRVYDCGHSVYELRV